LTATPTRRDASRAHMPRAPTPRPTRAAARAPASAPPAARASGRARSHPAARRAPCLQPPPAWPRRSATAPAGHARWASTPRAAPPTVAKSAPPTPPRH
jgi:hypothetical protein